MSESTNNKIPGNPTFGNIKMTPMDITRFKSSYDEKKEWSKGFAIAQYIIYLDANTHQHHYSTHETQSDWLAAAIDQYIKD